MAGAKVMGLLVLAAVLAGCAEGPEAALGPGEAPSGLGSLRGVVVDEALRPLAEAAVVATGASGTLNATTGADGLFRFDGLAAGVYVVEASKAFHIAQQQAVAVRERDEDPPVATFQLTFVASSLPFATVYKYDGFYECGAYSVRICSNVNIATWVVLCQYGVCVGNVTSDHSLFFQWIEAGPTLIQTELAWTATTETGKALSYLIGGGNEEELKGGVNLPAFNATEGESPLMLRITNHEGPDAWCKHVPPDPCEDPVLDNSRIGADRALLVQIDTGPWMAVPGCVDVGAPCAAGFAAQQQFTMFTSVFYGYEPPLDWLFTTTGSPPPPPAA